MQKGEILTKKPQAEKIFFGNNKNGPMGSLNGVGNPCAGENLLKLIFQ